jgi:hypothetical protein
MHDLDWTSKELARTSTEKITRTRLTGTSLGVQQTFGFSLESSARMRAALRSAELHCFDGRNLESNRNELGL